MKKCKKCGIEKDLSEFYKKSQSKDGLRWYCKACSRAYDKAYREANGDRIRKQKKVWYEANTSRLRVKEKAYREENKEKRNAYNRSYSKSWYKNNKDKRRDYFKIYRKNKKSERIEQLKKIIEPNTDDQWVYIMQCGIYNKIGISNDPLRRVEQVERETQAPTEILYLAKPFYGRTKDCEKIIHHELKCFNVPIPYAGSDTTSREWFFCNIDEITSIVSNYCKIKKVNN